MVQSLLYYASTQSWFPTDSGAPLPGISALLTFLIIVIALWWRGSSLPTRGEIVEQRLPEAPRPERLLRPTVICVVVGVVALIVLPFDYRNALMISMAGIVICLSFVVITGYVGQVSLVQVALAGAAGFAVSHLAEDFGIGFPLGAISGIAVATVLGFVAGVSALRVRGVTPGGGDAWRPRSRSSSSASRTARGARGRPARRCPSPTLLGLDLGAARRLPRAGRQRPEPGARLPASSPSSSLMGLFVARLRQSGLGQRMLAVRSNERAAAAAGRQRAQHEVRRVRASPRSSPASAACSTPTRSAR